MMADKNTSIYDLIGIGNIRKKYPPQTSTEKTVMQTVIGDMMSAYPSESYGIIFGSHGSGWLPTIQYLYLVKFNFRYIICISVICIYFHLL